MLPAPTTQDPPTLVSELLSSHGTGCGHMLGNQANHAASLGVLSLLVNKSVFVDRNLVYSMHHTCPILVTSLPKSRLPTLECCWLKARNEEIQRPLSGICCTLELCWTLS